MEAPQLLYRAGLLVTCVCVSSYNALSIYPCHPFPFPFSAPLPFPPAFAPQVFFLYFTLFHVYFFSFPFGFSYLALVTTVLFLQHSMLFCWNRYEASGGSSGEIGFLFSAVKQRTQVRGL